jgi:hypothetical protein
MAQIFVRKSLETLKTEASDESPHGDVKLNRALSMLNLIALGNAESARSAPFRERKKSERGTISSSVGG